jgi:hypothetical protein
LSPTNPSPGNRNDEERGDIVVCDGKVWPRANELSPATLGS